MKRITAMVLFGITMLLAGCGGPPAASPRATPVATSGFGTGLNNQVPIHTDVPGAPAHGHLDPSQATAEMQVALVASELVIGPNRFAVGLLDAKGQNIRQA